MCQSIVLVKSGLFRYIRSRIRSFRWLERVLLSRLLWPNRAEPQYTWYTIPMTPRGERVQQRVVGHQIGESAPHGELQPIVTRIEHVFVTKFCLASCKWMASMKFCDR